MGLVFIEALTYRASGQVGTRCEQLKCECAADWYGRDVKVQPKALIKERKDKNEIVNLVRM